MKQIKANLAINNRREWVNNFRQSIANYLSSVDMHITLVDALQEKEPIINYETARTKIFDTLNKTSFLF